MSPLLLGKCEIAFGSSRGVGVTASDMKVAEIGCRRAPTIERRGRSGRGVSLAACDGKFKPPLDSSASWDLWRRFCRCDFL